MRMALPQALSIITTLFVFCTSAAVAQDPLMLTVFNNCPYPIWPAIQPNSGNPVLEQGGFALETLTYRSFSAPNQPWSGRIWARTGCVWYNSRFTCNTGECNGMFQCNGVGGESPMSLAQLSLRSGSNGDLVSYEVSLVDGFNLPMTITPHQGRGVCPVAGCAADLLSACPSSLQYQKPPGSGHVVGCMSGCEAFNLDELCCRKEYAYPDRCKPYTSTFFKQLCPKTTTYPFDKPPQQYDCHSPRELKVVFCPSGV